MGGNNCVRPVDISYPYGIANAPPSNLSLCEMNSNRVIISELNHFFVKLQVVVPKLLGKMYSRKQSRFEVGASRCANFKPDLL